MFSPVAFGGEPPTQTHVGVIVKRGDEFVEAPLLPPSVPRVAVALIGGVGHRRAAFGVPRALAEEPRWLIADRPAVVVELLPFARERWCDPNEAGGAAGGERDGGHRRDVQLGDRLARADATAAVEGIAPRPRPAFDELAHPPPPRRCEQLADRMRPPDRVGCVVEQERRVDAMVVQDVSQLESVPQRLVGLVDLAFEERPTTGVVIDGQVDATRRPRPACKWIPRLYFCDLVDPVLYAERVADHGDQVSFRSARRPVGPAVSDNAKGIAQRDVRRWGTLADLEVVGVAKRGEMVERVLGGVVSSAEPDLDRSVRGNAGIAKRVADRRADACFDSIDRGDRVRARCGVDSKCAWQVTSMRMGRDRCGSRQDGGR